MLVSLRSFVIFIEQNVLECIFNLYTENMTCVLGHNNQLLIDLRIFARVSCSAIVRRDQRIELKLTFLKRVLFNVRKF